MTLSELPMRASNHPHLSSSSLSC